MTDKFEEIVDNLKQPSHWMRLPFMVAYGFMLYLIFVPVVIVMMVAQIFFALITGESNRNLRGLGSVVQQYVSQIIEYITYNSNERPFPFSDFPEEDISVVENSAPKKADSEAKAADSVSTLEEKEETQEKVAKPATKPATKPVAKSKKSTAKSKTANVSGETPSATKKPAKKKAPAKKKVSVQAAAESSETSSPPTQSDTQAKNSTEASDSGSS